MPQRLKACNSLRPLLCNTNGCLGPLRHKGSKPRCDVYGSGGWGFEFLRACHRLLGTSRERVRGGGFDVVGPRGSLPIRATGVNLGRFH